MWTLDWSENFRAFGGAEELKRTLNAQSGVRQVVLTRNQLDDAALTTFSEALAKSPELRVLHLRNNFISNYSLGSVSLVVKGSKTLEELDVSHNSMQNTGVRHLAEAIKGSKTLRVLNVGFNKFTVTGVAWLADALKTNTSIRELDCSGIPLRVEGADHLGQSLGALEVLTLKHTPMCSMGIEKLSRGIRASSTMYMLDLSYNIIGNVGAAILADAVPECASLCRLILADANIGDDGFVALAKAARMLIELDVTGNDISSDGVVRAVDHLKTSSVESLNLSSNYIGETGVRSLVGILTSPGTCIRELALSLNYIEDPGAHELARALPEMRTLQTLGIRGCLITDKGTAELARALETCSRHVYIYDGVTDAFYLAELRRIVCVSLLVLCAAPARVAVGRFMARDGDKAIAWRVRSWL